MKILSALIWVILGIVIISFIWDYVWIFVLVVAGFAVIRLLLKNGNANQDSVDTPAAPMPNLIQTNHDQSSSATCTSTEVHARYSDPLDTFIRHGVFAPSIQNGCPMLYRYPNVAISNVDRNMLREMVNEKNFIVEPIKDAAGVILLQWKGVTIARLDEKQEMCADWIDRNFPLRCEIAVFTAGKEKAALFFYKDQEATLQQSKCEVVKLTSCMSEEKQETISFLEEGEKLFLEWDDDDKPYLRDISYNPVGSLPAKFNKYIENDLIDGVFFDHTEVRQNDDWEKEDKLIPFVRVYTSEE